MANTIEYLCKKHISSLLSVPIFAFVVFATFFMIDNETLGVYLGGSYIALAFVSFLAIFFAYHSLDKSFRDERTMWLLIAISLAFRTFGEAFWWFYEVILEIDTPTHSFADAMWHLSYVLVIVALSYKIKQMFFENKKRTMQILVVLCILFSSIYLFWETNRALEFHSLTSYDSIQSLSDHLVNSIYVIEDLIVICLVVLISRHSLLNFHKISFPLIFLTLAFLSFLIYDHLFAEQILFETYSSRPAIDLIYAMGYVFLTFAGNAKCRYMGNKDD